jgi:cell division septation protein DedD
MEQRLDQVEGHLGEITLQLQKTANQLSNSNLRIQDQTAQVEQLQQQLERRSNIKPSKPSPELKLQLNNLEARLQSSEQALRNEVKLLASRLESMPKDTQQLPNAEPAQRAYSAPSPAATPKTKSYRKITKSSKRRGGPWVVNLASFNRKQDAQNMRRKLQRHGIFPHIKQVRVKGVNWYRLYVDGFANATAAQRYAATLKRRPELKQAWAGKAQ